MPLYKVTNNQGNQIDRYDIPFVINSQEITEEDLQIVKDHRAEYARTINEFVAVQKALASEKDYVGAKEMKEVIKYFTSCEKAATIVINYWEKLDKLTTANFPIELSTLLDYEFNCICSSQDKRLGL